MYRTIMIYCAMCHGFDGRSWSRELELEDEPDEETADDPSFAKEEPVEDAEILTDGGDEDE
jgi:hypothetical protein